MSDDFWILFPPIAFLFGVAWFFMGLLSGDGELILLGAFVAFWFFIPAMIFGPLAFVIFTDPNRH